MTGFTLAGGPHVHSMFSVSRTMITVMLCLTPATGFGLLQFGLPAAFLLGVTLLAAWAFEVICLALARKPLVRFATDGSALLTGWLVAMTLPPWAPWWVGVAGAGIAIVIGKHAFGGLGQNLFNPAMVARAMLLVALPVEMTTWIEPLGAQAGPGFQEALAITFGPGAAFDAVGGASPLGQMQSQRDAGLSMPQILEASPGLRDMFLGYRPGSLGETSAALLLGGGMCLVLLRIITIAVPLAVLGTVGLLAGVAWLLDPAQFPPPQYHLVSGSLVLCAFFIATDYVTSPLTGPGKLIYGVGIGALVFVIRSFGAFPEGVAFAVLLMNGCTPLIDTYVRPRIFGRTRRGQPLPLPQETSK